MAIVYASSEVGLYWRVWHIVEEEALLKQLAGEDVPAEIVSKPKRLEWLGSRVLARELCSALGLKYQGITKDNNGKPFLSGHLLEISLSHSFPYVAIQASKHSPVGIDIEQPKEKLLKVAPRILSAMELANAGKDVIKHCLYWCAKESLFKIYSKGGVHFRENLTISPFERDQTGNIIGSIQLNSFQQIVSLGYIVNSDFVLVYTLK